MSRLVTRPADFRSAAARSATARQITAPEPTLGRPIPDSRNVASPPVVHRVTVQVSDWQPSPSNLDEALYPDGVNKQSVINYYSRIAPVAAPAPRRPAGRPVTFIRFPDGVNGEQFN